MRSTADNQRHAPRFKTKITSIHHLFKDSGMQPKLFVILISLGLTCLSATQTAFSQASLKPTTSFQLYYGGDEKLLASLEENIEPNQIVVVDIRGLTAYQLGKLKRQSQQENAKILAYISIGELHSRELEMFDAFLAKRMPPADAEKAKSQILIGKNDVFPSYHIDVSSSHWREFIIDKAKNILASGVDGLFLDTVDTVDVYIGSQGWNLDRRCKSVTAMVNFIRELKRVGPGSPVIMQNRGLNMIGKEIFVGDAKGKMIPGLDLASPIKNNPDLILFENAFSSDGDWANAILKRLDVIQKSGEVTVVGLGYEDVIGDRDRFLEKCRLHRFVPAWSKNSESLHLQISRE